MPKSGEKRWLNKTEWGWGALGGFDGSVTYMFYPTDETEQRAWKFHIFNSPSVSLTGHMGVLDRLWTVTKRAHTQQRIHARTQEKKELKNCESFFIIFFQTVWNGPLSELLQNKKKDLQRYDMNSKTHIPGSSDTSVAIQQLMNIKRVCVCEKCFFYISYNLRKWSQNWKTMFHTDKRWVKKLISFVAVIVKAEC